MEINLRSIVKGILPRPGDHSQVIWLILRNVNKSMKFIKSNSTLSFFSKPTGRINFQSPREITIDIPYS